MSVPGGNRALGVIAAFAAVYVIWGSTYLAIRIAVVDLPPGLLAGVRFVLAGLILGLAAMLRGQRLPRSPGDWWVIVVMAVTLVVIGNGFVTWAEQWVASNQAALLIASSALWTAWFGTFGPRGIRLRAGAVVGLILGFGGVALLVWPDPSVSAEEIWGVAAILLSAVAWSGGMIYGRNSGISVRPLMLAALQMFVGGLMLAAYGLLAGELQSARWTAAGLGGMLYLTIFGSCIAYGSYIWLIHQTTPARLSTIAYVNPVIATALGWWVLDEALTGPQLAGMAVIVLGVAMVAIYGRAR